MSLPSWKATVGYEEGQDWVIGKMQCGYPRFFVHPIIQKLAREILHRHGNPNTEATTPFPSPKTACVCYSFLESRISAQDLQKVRVINFVPSTRTTGDSRAVTSQLSCVVYPKEHWPIVKQVWGHTGDGISSRRGEFCLGAFEDGFLIEEKGPMANSKPCKGPRRYQGKGSFSGSIQGLAAQADQSKLNETGSSGSSDGREYSQFIEERFGRNLSTSLADQAKLAVRRRIAGVLTADVDLSEALEKSSSEARMTGLTDDDVYLYPTGMSSIFHAHQVLLAAKGSMKSVCFGFPYVDTLKILEKWGPGCIFYGNGSSEDLDDLESRLRNGEKILGLFTELPGNPLLKSPDLKRIRSLADDYGFAVVVDETVGNFVNVNVLPYADIVVSSLTKIFSGDSNVMAGSAVVNPQSRYYDVLKKVLASEYEDNLWAEDAVFLERNSRDFLSRIEKINATTEAATAMLKGSSLGKDPTRPLCFGEANRRHSERGLLSEIFSFENQLRGLP